MRDTWLDVQAGVMARDPVVDGRDLVKELFPRARWAVLAGSVTNGLRTAGSDLDIVVVLPDGDLQAPHRHSRSYRDWPVELFVHDGVTLAHYLAKDLPGRRPVMHRMVATGLMLAGTRDEHARRTRSQCARVLAAGPAPLTDAELASARYGLTDTLDDLTHALDAGERTAIAAAAWIRSAEVALAVARHWTGSGKWLLRELRDMDSRLAARWVAAAGDPLATAAFLRDVLDRTGGPLFAGYHVGGERPTPALTHIPANELVRADAVPYQPGT